jgi:hypothetical protein
MSHRGTQGLQTAITISLVALASTVVFLIDPRAALSTEVIWLISVVISLIALTNWALGRFRPEARAPSDLDAADSAGEVPARAEPEDVADSRDAARRELATLKAELAHGRAEMKAMMQIKPEAAAFLLDQMRRGEAEGRRHDLLLFVVGLVLGNVITVLLHSMGLT